MAYAFLRRCKYLAALPFPKVCITWPSLFTSHEQRQSRSAGISETTISAFPLQLKKNPSWVSIPDEKTCASRHTAKRKADAEHLAENAPLWARLKILRPLKLLLVWFCSVSSQVSASSSTSSQMHQTFLSS